MSGILPRRCGTCKHFPSSKKRLNAVAKCKKNTVKIRNVVHANDHGKNYCDNYEVDE